jgi:hypothetical protein
MFEVAAVHMELGIKATFDIKKQKGREGKRQVNREEKYGGVSLRKKSKIE